MCSRFELSARPRDLARRFDLDDPPDGFATGEVRPTNAALIIGPDGPRVQPWGFAVEWDKKPLINARSETLAEKKTFQPLLENRCLVPASAYFEWRRDGKARFKNRIAPAGGGLFAFAGLTDGTRFTIVTRQPAAAIAHIHNRMPVILAADAEARWIGADNGFPAVQTLLAGDPELVLDAAEDTPPPPAQAELFG
ncbi:MAG: SOS response-associated peptidase [Magnetovibrio sp.]|nr:SOS response-associated peptidase [Magnetovibrio sp.]